MARHPQTTIDQAVARMLPPQSQSLQEVSKAMGISVSTLERWREQAHSMPARGRAWSAAARLDAVITTAAMDETAKNAWCRQQGVFASELDAWRAHCTAALGEPAQASATSKATRADKQRIKELERDLRRKEKALAETAALLVLSKKVEAIWHKGEDE